MLKKRGVLSIFWTYNCIWFLSFLKILLGFWKKKICFGLYLLQIKVSKIWKWHYWKAETLSFLNCPISASNSSISKSYGQFELGPHFVKKSFIKKGCFITVLQCLTQNAPVRRPRDSHNCNSYFAPSPTSTLY